jgi:hypothetical protein
MPILGVDEPEGSTPIICANRPEKSGGFPPGLNPGPAPMPPPPPALSISIIAAKGSWGAPCAPALVRPGWEGGTDEGAGFRLEADAEGLEADAWDGARGAQEGCEVDCVGPGEGGETGVEEDAVHVNRSIANIARNCFTHNHDYTASLLLLLVLFVLASANLHFPLLGSWPCVLLPFVQRRTW